MSKKDKIKELTVDMLNASNQKMIDNIDIILESCVVNIDDWDEKVNKMILPKSIVIALLQNESNQYNCIGTYFEKEIKSMVNKIKYVI